MPEGDAVDFARRVMGVEPFEHQEPALRSEAPWVVVAGGRRSGKTLAGQLKGLHTCFSRRNAVALVTSANESNVRRYLGEVQALVSSSPLAREAALDASGLVLRFRNGSSMVGVAPTGGQVRGRGRRVFHLAIDEAQIAPASLLTDARFVLLDHHEEGAQGWLIGSPTGPLDHFFRRAWSLGEEGDADYDSYRWPTALNPRLPAGWVERERQRLNAIEAAAEIDGLWQDDGAQFFPWSLLMECVADVELPGPEGLVGPARPAVSLDYGIEYDRSAATFLYRLPVGHLNEGAAEQARFLAVPHRWALKTRLDRVVDDVVGWPAPYGFVSTERVGLGIMPSDEVYRRLCRDRPDRGRRWCVVRTTAPLKLAAYSLLRWLFERHALVIPRDAQVLRELAGMKMTQALRGARLEAEDPSVHDDQADSLAFAMLPYVPRGGGRVACHLSALANVRRYPETLAQLDAPVVETGSGLRLYRRPVLQSLAGPELTLPPGSRFGAPGAAPPAPPPAWAPQMAAALRAAQTAEEATT